MIACRSGSSSDRSLIKERICRSSVDMLKA
jgi:hypothetical protein